MSDENNKKGGVFIMPNVSTTESTGNDKKKDETANPTGVSGKVSVGDVSIIINAAISTATGVIETDPSLTATEKTVMISVVTNVFTLRYAELYEAANQSYEQLKKLLLDLVLEHIPQMSDHAPVIVNIANAFQETLKNLGG